MAGDLQTFFIEKKIKYAILYGNIFTFQYFTYKEMKNG